MKKALTIILALALVMSLSVPAFAAPDSSKDTTLNFSLTIAGPAYTVTIPGTLPLGLGSTSLGITCQMIDRSLGYYEEIVVTFEGTQTRSGYRYYDPIASQTLTVPNGTAFLALSAPHEIQPFPTIWSRTTIPYRIYDTNNNLMPLSTDEWVVKNVASYGPQVGKNGSLLASFYYGDYEEEYGTTDTATKNIKILIDNNDVQNLIDSGSFAPGATYTGTITFGISFQYNTNMG